MDISFTNSVFSNVFKFFSKSVDPGIWMTFSSQIYKLSDDETVELVLDFTNINVYSHQNLYQIFEIYNGIAYLGTSNSFNYTYLSELSIDNLQLTYEPMDIII